MGRVERGVYPDAAVELLLAVTNPGSVRSFALSVHAEAVRDLEGIPQAVGLQTSLEAGSDGGAATLEIGLEDEAARDVFTVLAGDIVGAVSRAETEVAAVEAWVSRLRRWQRLLQQSPQGLSPEKQRGLYAELWVLREDLVPFSGIDRGLRAWVGPDKSVHDFQTPPLHLEVKSSVAGEPQVARINGERQLDDKGTPGLCLVHLSLAVSREEGETLPEMVARVRDSAGGGAEEALLEDRLADVGFHDGHAPRYRLARYTLRDRRVFQVAPGFPRIVESDLADGLGRVDYRLAIAACDPFEISEETLHDALREAYAS
jgi:Putative  PD-(D/E)XK family member, (DUF4420)